MSKKSSVSNELAKDKHDDFFCLGVKDEKIFGGRYVTLEFGEIDMTKRIAAKTFIWLVSMFNVIPPLVINSSRFDHPMEFGRVGFRQLGQIDDFDCRVE